MTIRARKRSKRPRLISASWNPDQFGPGLTVEDAEAWQAVSTVAHAWMGNRVASMQIDPKEPDLIQVRFRDT